MLRCWSVIDDGIGVLDAFAAADALAVLLDHLCNIPARGQREPNMMASERPHPHISTSYLQQSPRSWNPRQSIAPVPSSLSHGPLLAAAYGCACSRVKGREW